ncbi:MAG: alpha/beta hydrolase [Oscillospiraceae bacterium]|nr:alpha/beta hydrolase [Oscillospiraceae bacterium]
MEPRKYDPSLPGQIREKQFTTTHKNGMMVLNKAIPDADGGNVLDPRLREIIEMKRKMFSARAKGGWTLSGERYRPDKVTYDLTTTEVEVTERLIPAGDHLIDLYIYRPANAQPGQPALIYLHGGGFTAGDMRLYANQMKLIAEKSGAVVVFPEYRLAPECPFPGPIEDCWGAVQWVHAHATEIGADPEKLVLAGDSAGGSLSAACVLQDTDGIVKKLIGIYPGWDMRNYHDIPASEYTWSYEEYNVCDADREGAYSRIDRIKSGMEKSDSSSSNNLYLQGKTTTSNPLVSAACASDEQLKKFPETLVIAAQYDYLTVGADYAAKRLSDLGVPTRLVHYLGCDHGFLDMLGTIVQSEELCWTLADELTALK